ncbi:uncharacterized protein LOC143256719 [Tachypleus tridentatus]|uniref:uncharacterized protein LOC143256719 n=1 Tax=Tachypleus tridentatus TaxID=6853 RepID=UPI003FD26FD8
MTNLKLFMLLSLVMIVCIEKLETAWVYTQQTVLFVPDDAMTQSTAPETSVLTSSAQKLQDVSTGRQFVYSHKINHELLRYGIFRNPHVFTPLPELPDYPVIYGLSYTDQNIFGG